MLKKPEAVSIQGTCVSCATGKQMPNGRGGFKAQCRACNRRRFKMQEAGNARFRKHRGPTCERCGFVPQHPKQIEVHHRDRNRKNNTPENLESLCCNCHTLEHALNGSTPQ